MSNTETVSQIDFPRCMIGTKDSVLTLSIDVHDHYGCIEVIRPRLLEELHHDTAPRQKRSHIDVMRDGYRETAPFT